MSVAGNSPVVINMKKKEVEAFGFYSSRVQLQGKVKELQTDEHGLSLSTPLDHHKELKSKQRENDTLTIPWRDVIGVEDRTEDKKSAINLHYMISTPEKFLRSKCLNLVIEDESANKWIETIRKQCSNIAGRPKKLLVIVNPISGNGKARQLYENCAANLFNLANIEATVKETEKDKLGHEIVEQEDLSQYDGIVCVGGDGIYQNVLQGVFLKTQRQAGVDTDNPSSTWVKNTLPIGCLPAGTGNCMVDNCNDGVVDMETAVLRIVKGEQNYGTGYLTYANGKFVCVSGLCWAYGIFGDMVSRREELRWMGKFGMAVAFLSVLMRKRRMFKCELEYLQEETRNPEDHLTEKTKKSEEWTQYKGNDQQMCSIHSFAVELIDAGDKFVTNHFGTAHSLLVDRGSGMFGFMKHIGMYCGKKCEMPATIDIIENVKAFRLRLERDETETDENVTSARAKERYLENCVATDGELFSVDVPQFEVKILPSFIPLYSCLPTMPTEAKLNTN